MTHSLMPALAQRLHALDAAHLRRTLVVADSPCGPLMKGDGECRLAFNSNDYLGLAGDARLIAAIQEGAARYGAGSGASHLVCGHSRAHALLEERLADWLRPHIPDADSLYFSTGYMANLAVVGALVDIDRDGVHVFSEALNHASLIDGIRLSRARCTQYPHADTQALSEAMQASAARHKVVVTDGVFSMDGDLAPLREIVALCERHGAVLVVDDAHGFGVLGDRGHGILQHFGLRSANVVYVGTLGKAAGIAGAFVAAQSMLVDWLVQRARSYIYTTAAAPALAHAVQTSLDIIESDEGAQRRAHLQDLIAKFRASRVPSRWARLPSETAIQPIVVGDNAQVMRAAAGLRDRGLWVTGIRAPTVPHGSARLRITLSAGHTQAQLERLGEALASFDGCDPVIE